MKTVTLIYETEINEYEITADIDYSHDKNYGADADGNRGVSKWFIEDIIITNITSKSGLDIPVKCISVKTYNKIYKKIIDNE